MGAEESDLSSELLEPEPSVLREANQLSPYVSFLVTRLPRGRLKVNWEAAGKKRSWIWMPLKGEPAGMKPVAAADEQRQRLSFLMRPM